MQFSPWILAAMLLGVALALLLRPKLGGRPTADQAPRPQPTESEAIVAALRAQQTPQTPLVPPVPLPVDKAAALPKKGPSERV